MGRYNDSMQALVGSPALSKMLAARMGDESGEISETQAAIYGHLLIVYGIIEEAFLLYKKGWIDERNWLQWSAFLEALAKNPEFALIHANSSVHSTGTSRIMSPSYWQSAPMDGLEQSWGLLKSWWNRTREAPAYILRA